MKKIYNVNIVGTFNRLAIGRNENVIAKNATDAYGKLESKFDEVWSAHVKFNLKETIKVNMLNLLNLESISLEFRRRRICKNCQYFSKENNTCFYGDKREVYPDKTSCGAFKLR